MLEEVVKGRGGEVRLARVDVDQLPELAGHYQVTLETRGWIDYRVKQGSWEEGVGGCSGEVDEMRKMRWMYM